MLETPILSSYPSVEELQAINRELVTQCAERNRKMEKALEKSEEKNKKLSEKITKLKATIQILEAEVESLRKIKTSLEVKKSVTFKPERPHHKLYTNTSSGEMPVPERPHQRFYTNASFGDGPVKFGWCHTGGNYLELENQSDEMVEIGNFTIKRIVEGAIIEVVLPKVVTMQARTKLRIYGKKSTTEKLNIQMLIHDQVEHWLSGKLMQTSLLNEEGKEVASIIQTED